MRVRVSGFGFGFGFRWGMVGEPARWGLVGPKYLEYEYPKG